MSMAKANLNDGGHPKLARPPDKDFDFRNSRELTGPSLAAHDFSCVCPSRV